MTAPAPAAAAVMGHYHRLPRMMVLVTIALLTLDLILLTHADTYLHAFRGGNNRLNEQGPERNNGARLWDSQNNNRGGYNAGSIQREYFYEGSVAHIEWTQQHSCGNVHGNNCEMILQYTCGDPLIRDGTTTNTIPRDPAQCTDAQDSNCDLMLQYGRHESQASYNSCRYRSRNKGLFISNQRMQGPSARFTRQNNDGGRSGLECPEERDYYPYWHPTIWRDIAIITNRPERCLAFQQESQNVKGRYYCQWDTTQEVIQTQIANDAEGWVPITKEECEANTAKFPGGKWVHVEPFNIPAPDCIQASYTRDNHLGNAVPADPTTGTEGFPNYYNWTIPSVDISANCVFRLRYNISTGDFPYQGYSSDFTVTPGVTMDWTSNMVPLNRNNPDNNARYPSNFPIWSQYGLSLAENNGSFTARVQNDDPNDNTNGGRLGGIRKAQPPSRDYTLRDNPQVDIFGSLLPGNKSSDPAYYGQPMIRTRLAVNTAQYGRTFQDRSHVFEIRARPPELAGVKIHNLNVRGKKGNIVQTYPGVEYDFVPDRLHVTQGDMVHIQWTGSIPADGEGQGNKGDRNNLIGLRKPNYVEYGQSLNPDFPLAIGHLGNSYPVQINDTTNYPPFLGLDYTRLRILALYGLNASYFDMPVQALTPGQFMYFCTRNNAFSNRSQKGLIVVAANATWAALGDSGLIQTPTPVSVTGEAWSASRKAALKQAWFDGTELIPGSVTIHDTVNDTWFLVNPPVTNLGINDGDLTFEADRPMPNNFFYKGQIMWKLNANDEPIELIPDSNFYATQNKITVTQGGYYQSTSVPNPAMIAGIAIGVVGIITIFVFLYWKVRVQPMGGWKEFCNKSKSDSSSEEDHPGTELLPTSSTSATSSSALNAAAAGISTSSVEVKVQN